ncbi:MAG: hypothetical protein ACFE95_20270 [Candidatus Hodarchaeota archaeon]
MDHQKTEILELKRGSNFLISVIFEQNLHYFVLRQELYENLDIQGEEDIILYLTEAKEIVKKWDKRLI